jgi:gas vesicle protein
MRRISSFTLGAFLGALLASSVALLLAPSSGSRLRGQIQSFSQQLTEDVKAAANQRRDELQKEITQLRAPQKPAGE